MNPVRVSAAVRGRARSTAVTVGALLEVPVDADELIGGRAALLGLESGGRVSAGGATHLMDGPGGWCALTLSRPDDVDAVPALIGSDDIPPDPWAVVHQAVRDLGVPAFAERARLLGLPVGVLGETSPAPAPVRPSGARAPASPLSDLLVADLSSMWAGPLCGRLLAAGGATVVKVESPSRPDGTRLGPPEFFDWLNSEKLSYTASFGDSQDAAGLRRLLAAADVVIESSRPAALQRHRLGPEDVPARPGRIWVRITGHGAAGERAEWVAFGDDAAVSGGLVAGRPGAPEFCGDAIADPLTGLQAAESILTSRERGGGEVIEVAMAAVAARYAELPRGEDVNCDAPPLRSSPVAPPGSDNDLVDRLVHRRLEPLC